MILLALLYVLFVAQILESFWKDGLVFYKDPKIWLHLVSLGVVTYLTTSISD